MGYSASGKLNVAISSQIETGKQALGQCRAAICIENASQFIVLKHFLPVSDLKSLLGS